jgi:6-phosphogluconolactonase/glucosamine-6-phosphate isomerase/deaminase
MEVIRTSSPAEDAGKALSEALERRAGSPVLLMLSGGSAFLVLEHVDEGVFGPNLTLGVLDERCSKDLQVNNYLQLKETTFFKNAVAKGAQIISSEVQDGEDCEEIGEGWKGQLLNWEKENPEGVIIATMGIGPDGHVAGIFPKVKEVAFNSSEIVVSYSVSPEVNKFTERITVTYTFLKEYVDEVIAYAVGEEKSEIIKELEENTDNKDTSTVPARVFNQMSLVRLYTDNR